jgi:hypothetical protein
MDEAELEAYWRRIRELKRELQRERAKDFGHDDD